MKNKVLSSILALTAVFILASCHKPNEEAVSPVVGHWGCEQYVSCRTDSTGFEKWDTLCYEACVGGEYEIFFNADGKGLLKLNNSPAFIKEFSCKYAFDSVRQVISVEGSAWLFALYGSLYMDENYAEFNIEQLTDSTLVASWTNHVSEPIPFFERFFLKRIE